MRDRNSQVGGDHYKKRKIQPFDIIDEYEMTPYEAAVLKYLLRHKDKNGKEDILKLIDYAHCIIDRVYPEGDESIMDVAGKIQQLVVDTGYNNITTLTNCFNTIYRTVKDDNLAIGILSEYVQMAVNKDKDLITLVNRKYYPF